MLRVQKEDRVRDLTATEPAGATRLLDEDPELGRDLASDQFRAARRVLVVPVCILAPGRWTPRTDPVVDAAVFGVLVLDGLLARQVTARQWSSVELVGSGDLVRLRDSDPDSDATVPLQTRWRVLVAARLAVIDEECVRCAAAVPALLGELAARGGRRADSLALLLATAQVRDVAGRLLLVLWLLADRWGRHIPSGIALRLPLSQETLAALVCAKRTSVTAALKKLEFEGRVARPRRGEIVLLGDPPADEPQGASGGASTTPR